MSGLSSGCVQKSVDGDISGEPGLDARPRQVDFTVKENGVLHSAGPAHNLERIFYAILRLKAGRSEIVATTSVGELFGHQTARGQSDV